MFVDGWEQAEMDPRLLPWLGAIVLLGLAAAAAFGLYGLVQIVLWLL